MSRGGSNGPGYIMLGVHCDGVASHPGGSDVPSHFTLGTL